MKLSSAFRQRNDSSCFDFHMPQKVKTRQDVKSFKFKWVKSKQKLSFDGKTRQMSEWKDLDLDLFCRPKYT